MPRLSTEHWVRWLMQMYCKLGWVTFFSFPEVPTGRHKVHKEKHTFYDGQFLKVLKWDFCCLGASCKFPNQTVIKKYYCHRRTSNVLFQMVILENIAFAFYFLCKLFHSYRARRRKKVSQCYVYTSWPLQTIEFSQSELTSLFLVAIQPLFSSLLLNWLVSVGTLVQCPTCACFYLDKGTKITYSL